jgi:4-hydroxybenzoate polyprenyltransferase
MARFREYIELSRPFTLLPPLLGILSGAVTAFGSAHNPDRFYAFTLPVLLTIITGSLAASFLNAASNGVNQIYDLPIDAVNKPGRPLPAKKITMRGAWIFTMVLYVMAVIPTWLVVVHPRDTFMEKLTASAAEHACFYIYLVGLLATLVYSVPLFGRSKRHWFWANFTIAVPRGCLLKVAGWSMVAGVNSVEPWYIGSVVALFLLFAASTKDFSDMAGDQAGGCITLPLKFGVKRAAWMMAPSFVLPWLLLPLGVMLRDPFNPEHTILTGTPWLLMTLGFVLSLWGAYTVWLILRDPEALARSENHPAWKHMYLMMMAAQAGLAVAYLPAIAHWRALRG